MTLRQHFKKWLYGSCPGFAGSFPYFGVRVHFPPRSQIFAIACAQGIYEQENLRVLSSALRPGGTVYDVGANIGLLSVPLLSLEPTVRVISIEPSPAPLACLRRTLAGSGRADRWEVRGEAVSDRAGMVEFACADPALAIYDGMRDTHRAGRTTTVQVPATTLDLLWETQGRPPVCAVKIDVEGAEAAVLRGGAAMFRTCRPLVLVEWNADNLRAYGCPPRELLDRATALGLAVHAMPSLVGVESEAHLSALMKLDENFVLLPR